MTERLFVRLEEDSSHGPETTAPAGTLRSLEVSRPLRGTVAHVLLCRESLPRGEVVLERVLPDAAVRLAFNFGDLPSADSNPGYAVEAIGASGAPAIVRLSGELHGVTVTLRLGAAHAVLGLPAREIRNGAVHLDELWHGEASRVLARMAEAPDDAARMAVLEAALLDRVRRNHTTLADAKVRLAARHVAQSEGRIGVRALADALGVTERRLQQLFDTHVGLSPRAFIRLSRLHTCLRLLRREPGVSWARVAAHAGYYDQAHLANEFKALSGLTPSAFLTRASGSSKTAS